VNNRDPILNILKRVLQGCNTVLEIGSGTGQHAVWFGRHLPHLEWCTSDRIENHEGIKKWLEEEQLHNVHAPIALDVVKNSWPKATFDAIFSANTAHIMAWPEVEVFVTKAACVLPSGGRFCLYGPFDFKGREMAPSNKAFDAELKSRGAHQGIRKFDAINDLARKNNLIFSENNDLPANNHLLIWRKN
jgi:cyclopropane fatty-acyl-phospholipid synthase-like methyltransferase